MRHLVRGFSGLLIAVAFSAAAQDQYDAVEQSIRTLAPSVKDIAISETPIDNIVMVQVDGDIVYATADGQYLIQGSLVNMETRENLTEAAKSGMRKKIMDSIDRSKQITFAPENPDYELTVFTDIDCGYCRKLHSQMDDYNANGIAINYMAFPRAGIGSRSYEKFVSVWCSDDQQTALTKAKAGADPDPEQCDNPVAEQYQVGVDLGVTGTPALVTNDGDLIPGYVPPAQLRQRLERMAAAHNSE
jgi:thiol:disulfide interchange protein DsbC